METILKNGNIITMDETTPRAEAMAIQFGRIYRVGVTADIENLAHPDTLVLDLKGKTVFPGLIDTHNHFCLYSFLVDQTDCRPSAGCASGADIVETIREKASHVPPGKWILGWGYAPYLLDDQKSLTREDLDQATQNHPVCLMHVSVHGAVVNSAALKELNYHKDTPDPAAGKIHKDASGKPNGVLSESAIMMPLFFNSASIYSKMMAEYTQEKRTNMMIRSAQDFHRLGLVCAHDPFVDPATLRTYQNAAATGSFAFRLSAYIHNLSAPSLLAGGIEFGFGSEWVKVGAIKIFLDGGMSSRTAAVFDPYLGGGGGTGILNYDLQGIDEQIRKFDQAGYQIAVHAQGDRALDMLLIAFSRIIDKGNPRRHQIVHAGNITASQIDHVAELNLSIVSQANFLSLLGDGFIEAFGPARSGKLYPFRTLLDHKIKLALSSDCPVADPNPLIGIRDAICRKTASGQLIGPSESITAEQAFGLYTREAARVSFEEEDRGSIVAGKRADLVVFDRDPLSVSPDRIPDTRVEMTVVGGKIVFDNRKA